MSAHKSPVEIDYDELFRASDEWMSAEGSEALVDLVKRYGQESYEAGRAEVLTTGEVRSALLTGQSDWLDAAAKARNAGDVAAAYLAETVAKAFGAEADRYRQQARPELPQSSLEDPSDVRMQVVDEMDTLTAAAAERGYLPSFDV